MKNRRKFPIAILALVLVVLLVACKNSPNEQTVALDNQSNNADSTENTGINNNDTNDKQDLSKNTPEKEEDTPVNTAVSLKEEYFQKLATTTKKTDKMEAADSSTYALKKVEGDRFDIWDEMLNEVYRVIKNQLSPDEMDLLREEQRNWITYRDNTAKEASLKYEGGTLEQLEYVAVLAKLTEERCYKLVEDHLK